MCEQSIPSCDPKISRIDTLSKTNVSSRLWRTSSYLSSCFLRLFISHPIVAITKKEYVEKDTNCFFLFISFQTNFAAKNCIDLGKITQEIKVYFLCDQSNCNCSKNLLSYMIS